MTKHFRHLTKTKQFGYYGNDAKNKCDFSLDLKVCREFDDVSQLANCSTFVPRRRETFGRRQWTVAEDETSNADVDDDRRRCRPGILATG